MIATLEREGVEKFEASWQELLDGVRKSLEAAAKGQDAPNKAAKGNAKAPRRPAAHGSAASEAERRHERPSGRAGGGGRRARRLRRGRGRPAAPGLDPGRAGRRPASRAGWPARTRRLWGPDAEAEAKIRLGWVDTFRRSRELLPQLAELTAELADLDHVVLAGMGGSSLAPEVITRTLGRPLTVLDTTDPDQVRAALGDRLERTVVVVASKSGSTVETDSHRRAYWQAFLDAGLTEAEAGRHFVIVTDPGSPLEATAAEMGAFTRARRPGRRRPVLRADRVRAGALGAGRGRGRRAARPGRGAGRRRSAADRDNPALALGAALGAAATLAGTRSR